MKKATFIVTLSLAVAIAIPLLAQAQTYYTGQTTYNAQTSASVPVVYGKNPQTSYAQYPAVCPQLSYNLVLGSTDYYTQGQVSQLQRFLASRYGGQSVTGYFGYVTAGNVARFQQEQQVYPATGGVGPITRAAIQKVCGGSGAGVFYFGTPFTLAQGASATESTSNLSVTLNQITYQGPMYYGGPAQPSSASITLTKGCAPGIQCFYAPQQQLTLQSGESANFQGYTVTLRSVATAAVFVVTKTPVNTSGVSAYPQSGSAPLTVTFTLSNYTGQYAVDFGDGTNSSQLSGPVTHTYYNGGTYTAQFQSDPACRHQTPACAIATLNLGSATVTVGAGQQNAGTITGRVTVGPSCPVQSTQYPCQSAAYQTTIDVYQNGSFIKSVQTDLDGRYTLPLPLGVFELRARGGQVYPVCPAKTVNLLSGTAQSYDIECDSGIR